MPVSPVRKKKKAAYTPPAPGARKKKKVSPRWIGPAVLTLLLTGVVWLVVAYMTEGQYPMDLGNGNILVGFGAIALGFALATQWY